MATILSKNEPLEQLVGPPRGILLAGLIGLFLCYAGSLPMIYLLSQIAPQAQGPDMEHLRGSGWFAIFMLVIFAPVLETAALALITSILLRFVSPLVAILMSAIGWGVVHSLEAPIWGLVIAWPFIVFTSAFVAWKKRSIGLGLFMAFFIHALNNLLPAISVGYPDLIPIPAI